MQPVLAGLGLAERACVGGSSYRSPARRPSSRSRDAAARRGRQDAADDLLLVDQCAISVEVGQTHQSSLPGSMLASAAFHGAKVSGLSFIRQAPYVIVQHGGDGAPLGARNRIINSPWFAKQPFDVMPGTAQLQTAFGMCDRERPNSTSIEDPLSCQEQAVQLAAAYRAIAREAKNEVSLRTTIADAHSVRRAMLTRNSSSCARSETRCPYVVGLGSWAYDRSDRCTAPSFPQVPRV